MSNTETERTKALRNIGPSSIATVDNVPAEDVVSLKVYVEPVQDLHGYDHPWPAGGGKNLLKPYKRSVTASGVTYSVADDGKITLSGTATSNNSFSIWPSSSEATVKETGLYTVSMYGAQNAKINGADTSTLTVNADTVPNTFAVTITSGTVYNESFYVQIESGSTATTFAPYTNICPISGRTGANVTRTGKNLLDFDDVLDNAYVDGATKKIITIDGANAWYANVPKNTQITYSADKGNRLVIAGYKVKPATVLNSTADVLLYNMGAQVLTSTFNSGENTFIAIYPNRDQANKPTWIQLELGSTATAYEPYTGTTLPISWQSEAGTVYGGTLDVTTGLLTVDRASKTFDGSETWEWYSNRSLGMSDVSGGVITDRVTQYNKYVTNCDLFKTESWVGMNRTGTVGMFYGQSKIYLKYDGFTSADDIKTFLAANPMTIVYELATPQTYQLTPTQIALLAGENNVWADCGDILKMRYWSYDLLLNKVVYDNNTLIDLTGDTITPEVMLAGYTAHDATGSEIEGSIEIATTAEVRTYFGLS